MLLKPTMPSNNTALNSRSSRRKRYFLLLRIGFLIFSCAILYFLILEIDLTNISSKKNIYLNFSYFLSGICAALIANSTGVGGGVVFLPVFISLGFSPTEALAISIAIQCFGMTSGSLSWLQYKSEQHINTYSEWSQFFLILGLSIAFSFIGVAYVQLMSPKLLIDIEIAFSIFSIIIGCLIIRITINQAKNTERIIKLNHSWKIILVIISGLIGGAITAWISVGVGEILAICLIFLGYQLNFAIAIAVCASAATVIFALPYHASSVNLELLVCVAPGALIGGAVARKVTITIGAYRMKILMALWIIFSAVIFLFVSI